MASASTASLHAGVRIHANDLQGWGRVCRYAFRDDEVWPEAPKPRVLVTMRAWPQRGVDQVE